VIFEIRVEKKQNVFGIKFCGVRIWGQASEIRYFLFLPLIKFSPMSFVPEAEGDFNQVIFKMVYLLVPPGVFTSTSSSTSLLMRALPRGEAIEILPEGISDSSGPTI